MHISVVRTEFEQVLYADLGVHHLFGPLPSRIPYLLPSCSSSSERCNLTPPYAVRHQLHPEPPSGLVSISGQKLQSQKSQWCNSNPLSVDSSPISACFWSLFQSVQIVDFLCFHTDCIIVICRGMVSPTKLYHHYQKPNFLVLVLLRTGIMLPSPSHFVVVVVVVSGRIGILFKCPSSSHITRVNSDESASVLYFISFASVIHLGGVIYQPHIRNTLRSPDIKGFNIGNWWLTQKIKA